MVFQHNIIITRFFTKLVMVLVTINYEFYKILLVLNIVNLIKNH